jgi:hypothetical protein
MERRMKKSVLTFGVLILLGLALTTCSNPIDILASITTEVKSATGKFLVVNGLSPSSPTNVNPAVRLRVEFDRPLNMDTVQASSVKIQKSDGSPDSTVFQVKWEPTSDHKILYVWADPYMGNATDYTLTLTRGMLAADGGDLKQEYSWQFKTGTFPAGSIKINAGAAYTRANPVDLSIDCNLISDKYRLGYAADLTGTGWTSITSWPFMVPNYQLDPSVVGDGPRSVYVQFAGPVDGSQELSLVQSATVILDTQPPVLTPATLPATIYVNKARISTGVTPISATDTWSGVTFNWNLPAGVTANAGALNAATDGTYTPISLTVTDGAGNTTTPAGSTTLVRDTYLNPPRWDYDNFGLPYVLWNSTTPPALTWNWVSGGGGETPAQFSWKGDLGSGKGSVTSFTYSKDYKPDTTYILLVNERDNALNSATSAEMGLAPTSGPVAPPSGSKNVLVPEKFEPASTARVFQWQTYPLAVQYDVVVDTKGSARGKHRVLQPTNGTDPFLSWTLEPNIEFYWYVNALDGSGKLIGRIPASGSSFFATGILKQ